MSIFVRARKEYSLLYGNMANEFVRYDEERPLVYMGDDVEFLRATIGSDASVSASPVLSYSVDVVFKRSVILKSIAHSVSTGDYDKTIRLVGPDSTVIAERSISNNTVLSVEVLRELPAGVYKVVVESSDEILYNYGTGIVDGSVFRIDTFYEGVDSFTGSIQLTVEYL